MQQLDNNIAMPRLAATEKVALDEDIPIPAIKRSHAGRKRNSKYPFKTAQIGQSFLAKSVRLTHWTRQTGFSFTKRLVVIDGELYFRVWRTR